MDWNYISDNKYPKQFEEVIICSSLGKVKTAIYMGNKKWNTFFDVVCWTTFPESPVKLNSNVKPVEHEQKKRGRPKKI
jgi:hypothetical protein